MMDFCLGQQQRRIGLSDESGTDETNVHRRFKVQAAYSFSPLLIHLFLGKYFSNNYVEENIGQKIDY